MAIKLQTNIDYTALCNELGVTIDELVLLIKNKDKHLSKSIEKVLLVQVIAEYSENLKKLQMLKRRSETTERTYLNVLERVESYVNQTFPDMSISELNEDLIIEILMKSSPRKSTELTTNTINKYMAIIRSLLKYAFEHGYTEKDLRYKFSIHKTSTLPRYLNELQEEQVLKGALQKTYGYRKRTMLLFLLGTGCRVSELTNLRVKDFNVPENLIFIRKGKGNKERAIPIFKEVKVAVLHYLKISGVPEWKSDMNGYLFAQDEGLIREKKVLERSIQQLVRDLFDSIGLGRDYTVHSFRSTFAVKCLKAGISQPFLMQMLGHEDPQTTAIYTKLLPRDLKEEVMKFYPFQYEDLLKELI